MFGPCFIFSLRYFQSWRWGQKEPWLPLAIDLTSRDLPRRSILELSTVEKRLKEHLGAPNLSPRPTLYKSTWNPKRVGAPKEDACASGFAGSMLSGKTAARKQRIRPQCASQAARAPAKSHASSPDSERRARELEARSRFESLA